MCVSSISQLNALQKATSKTRKRTFWDILGEIRIVLYIHFLISISDSKDNIAEDTLVHMHFNKMHMKQFVKPLKQSKRL